MPYLAGQPDVGSGLHVGDRVKLRPEAPSWKVEIMLQGKTGEIVELRDDGRVTVRFDGGRLLMGQEAGFFEGVAAAGQKAKK